MPCIARSQRHALHSYAFSRSCQHHISRRWSRIRQVHRPTATTGTDSVRSPSRLLHSFIATIVARSLYVDDL